MNQYDRIISCAVLEHIDNLPLVISRSGLLLKEGGCFQASVPSEGGLLWKVGYTLTTGLEFRLKYHLDYNLIMKHEHLNSVDEIEKVIRCFYYDVKLKRLGISKNFSLYTYLEAKNPNTKHCKDYYYENISL